MLKKKHHPSEGNCILPKILMELIAIVVGLILLLKGGDWLMKSAVAISLELNISRFVIGMTVVSFATSAPELIVSIQAAVSGFPDLAFGNVIGSNNKKATKKLETLKLYKAVDFNKHYNDYTGFSIINEKANPFPGTIIHELSLRPLPFI